MTDLDRRNLLAGLAGGLGLAAAATAVPALAQLQKQPVPGEPRSIAPRPTGRIETMVTFEGRDKLTGRALFGQMQERLILTAAGAAGASGRLIISAVHGAEVACWVSRPFALTDGRVRLMHSGCTVDPSIFTETTDWSIPPVQNRSAYEAAKPSVTGARRFISDTVGRTLQGASQGYAVMLMPESGTAVCNIAQFYGSVGLEPTFDVMVNRGYIRPPSSLPALPR